MHNPSLHEGHEICPKAHVVQPSHSHLLSLGLGLLRGCLCVLVALGSQVLGALCKGGHAKQQQQQLQVTCAVQAAAVPICISPEHCQECEAPQQPKTLNLLQCTFPTPHTHAASLTPPAHTFSSGSNLPLHHQLLRHVLTLVVAVLQEMWTRCEQQGGQEEYSERMSAAGLGIAD